MGEHIYHPAGVHAALRTAIMSAKSNEAWYDTLAWLYGSNGLGSPNPLRHAPGKLVSDA